MTTILIIKILAIILLLTCSAISSGSETALTAISKLKSFDGLNMQMNLFDQHFRKFILIFSPE